MWDQKTKTYKDLSQLATLEIKDTNNNLVYQSNISIKKDIDEEIEACQIAIECHENEIKKLQAKIEELSK